MALAVASLNTLRLANYDFSMDLYPILNKDDENLFYSPLSIHIVLLMAGIGAASKTYDEIFNTIHMPKDVDTLESYEQLLSSLNENDAVKLATGMFLEKSYNIKQSYIDRNTKYLRSSVEKLDFIGKPEDQRNFINQWVENKTNGKIKDLFPTGSIDTDTRLILASALHFKSNWDDEFNPAVDEPFYLTAEKSVTTKMMYLNEDLKYYHDDDLAMSAIELPYIDSIYKMMILLPDAKDGLTKLENNLPKMKLSEISKKMSIYNVDLTMPKFKITQEINLVDALNKRLGCSSMFSSNANFSKISDDLLVVSGVVHKAFINVDEKGTEAAAAMGLKMVPLSGLMAESVQFNANHPFIFLIMSRKNDVLFMGNLKKPSN